MNGMRYYHPEESMVYACPNCDRSPIVKRQGDNVTFEPDKRFACYKCHSAFNEPCEREEKTPTGGSSVHGMAAKLDAMDPDELGAGS